tara:strand:- start:28819 stop:29460 length:642 start_codon:yes stop_codon:yes gene_type:complete
MSAKISIIIILATITNMGLFKIIKKEKFQIGIWQITETVDELKNISNNLFTTKNKNTKRVKETIINNILVNKLLPNAKINYNNYGAPFLENKFISISHTKKIACVIISDYNVGIDVEEISNRPLQLANKFVSHKNKVLLTEKKALIIWCFKEAIFKWYEKGNISFKKDIIVNNFKTNDKGIVKAKFKNKLISGKFIQIKNHYLVYLCEKKINL